MQDFQSRHEKWIKPNWGFVCLCDRCEEEKSNLESDKTFCKKFDEIRKKAKKLHNENESDQPIKLEKIMLEVLFYEEMYKMAKEKKTSWSFMIDHILDYAFDAAAQGYICAQKKIRSDFSIGFTNSLAQCLMSNIISNNSQKGGLEEYKLFLVEPFLILVIPL